MLRGVSTVWRNGLGRTQYAYGLAVLSMHTQLLATYLPQAEFQFARTLRAGPGVAPSAHTSGQACTEQAAGQA